MADDYREVHKNEGYGVFYDKDLFTEGSFGYEMWQKEKKILEYIVEKHTKGGRYLDFACGTGRILTTLEDKFDEPIGVDISETMLEQAKKKAKKSKFILGDATLNDNVVEGKFDCISSFRFFLNAQDELRHKALKMIHNKLRNDESIFIFNIHGNKYSSRWFLVLFDRIFNISKQNQMSLKEIKNMIEPHGLEIVEYYGVGFIYKVFYKFMPKTLWRILENSLAKTPFMKPFSLYFIFVCRKKTQ